MATPRNSAPVDFGRTNQPAIQSAQVGAAPVDGNQFYKPDALRGHEQDNALLGGLLDIITPAVTKLATVDMEIQREEAYLRGSAAAGAKQAEKEVESNVLTKDWATAGYRDTVGRLKAADAEAQTAVDMKAQRELPPAKFEEYLARRRDGLMESFTGMSKEARKAMLSQQLVSDRAAIAKHATEHQAFIISKETQGVSRSVSVKFDALDSAKVDATAYGTATGNAFMGIYGDVWQNPNLPLDVRQKLTSEAMQGALARNHQQLFQMFKDQKITLPDGTEGTMFSQLPFDEQTKLVKANETSMSSTAHIRSVDYDAQMGLMVASWEDPTKPMTSYADLQAKIAQGIQSGFIGKGDVEKYNRQWADHNQKKAAAGNTAAAWQSGNVQALSDLQKTDAEGAQAWMLQQQMSKRPVDQIAGDALVVGLKTGSHAAFKTVSELTKSGWALLGTETVGAEATAQTLSTVIRQVERAALQPGNAGAMSAFLSGLGDDERMKAVYFLEALQLGKDSKAAAAIAAEAVIQDKQLGLKPGGASTQHAANDKDNDAIVKGIQPMQLFGTMGNAVAAWFSKDSANRKAIGTKREWFESTEAAEAATAGTHFAFLEELNVISRTRPTATAASRETAALAAVAKRTVMTKDGPLHTPRLMPGMTVQKYFGVDESTQPDTIGAAISEKFGPTVPGGRIAYRSMPSGNGGIRFTEYRGDVEIRSGTFNAKDVQALVAEKNQARTDRFNATDGTGITKQGPDGSQVTYNGQTTVSGLGTDKMLEFRSDLVKYEGVRGSAYDAKSTKGEAIKVTGVGIASTNTFYPKPGPDGKVPQAALDLAFMQASNAAAEFGMRAARQAGLANNNSAFKLMAGMAYQANDISAKDSYKPFINALAGKNAATAKAEFQKTAVWKDAQGNTPAGEVSKRNAYYLDLIDKSLR